MTALAELRAVTPPTPSGKQISGYASLFDAISSDLGGFVETVRAGAFTQVLGDDVRALINHDPNLVLGRTRAGTLRLRQDATGLAILCHPPATTFAEDLVVSLGRRDLSQMSFSFVVGKDRWSNRPDGLMLREVLRVDKLYDVSIVTFPAYEATTAAFRHPAAGSTALPGIPRRAAARGALAQEVARALGSARCSECGALASSLEIEWRSSTPTGVGRCARHRVAAPRPSRPATSTPRLNMARRRQRLRDLDARLGAGPAR